MAFQCPFKSLTELPAGSAKAGKFLVRSIICRIIEVPTFFLPRLLVRVGQNALGAPHFTGVYNSPRHRPCCNFQNYQPLARPSFHRKLSFLPDSLASSPCPFRASEGPGPLPVCGGHRAGGSLTCPIFSPTCLREKAGPHCASEDVPKCLLNCKVLTSDRASFQSWGIFPYVPEMGVEGGKELLFTHTPLCQRLD